MRSGDSSLRVPLGPAEITLGIKGSQFIARAEPAGDISAVKAVIDSVKGAHPNATHVVYAYRVGGYAAEEYGMSDAGEPKGTAGRPTLEVLKGNGIADVVLTTVRYFGGTKLGTGGLVRAYTEAAQAVLAELPTESLVAQVSAEFVVDYEYADTLKRLIGEYRAQIVDHQYGETVRLQLVVAEADFAQLRDRARDVSRGTLRLRVD